MKRLGILVNTTRPTAATVLSQVEGWAKAHGWPIEVVEEISAAQPARSSLTKATFAGKIDLLLALGGDGTILTAARAVAGAGIPILGINLGRLGFLTVASPEESASALDRVESGNFVVEERLMLAVHGLEGEKEPWPALNDVVIDKGGIARMITLHVHLNGEFLNEVAGDGLIVATPTGSTAYALSVGGPILMPTTQVYVLAPISPHTLAQRPVVLATTDRLEITIKSVVGASMLTVDGQRTRELPVGACVEVRPAEFAARLITFPDRSFLRVLRSKLHWGLGPGENPR